MLHWVIRELLPWELVDFLLSLHNFRFRIKIKVPRMVKMGGVQDNKTNHVIVTTVDLRMLDLQTAIAIDLVLGLPLVDGMLVILLRLVAAMVQALIMKEILLAEIVEVRIVDEVAGPAETTIANVALPVVAVAQPHQDLTAAETNGLDMIIQLAKTISKV